MAIRAKSSLETKPLKYSPIRATAQAKDLKK